jgi:glycolate oxidase
MYAEADVDLMWQLRCAIDPGQIANRGKMFPAGEASSVRRTGLHPLERQGVISRE